MPQPATVAMIARSMPSTSGAHAEPGAAEVEQRIDHELARAVIGHLSAAIDLHHRDVAGREHVLGTRVHAEREDRRMLEEPDLVAASRVRARP